MPTQAYHLKSGKRVPGVTTVIGKLGYGTQGLIYAANQLGLEGKNTKDVWGKEATAGSIAHEYIECDLKNKLLPEISKHDKAIQDKVENSYLAWLEFKGGFDFKLLASEQALVSEKYGYGGTIDIATMRNKTSILDLKTAKATYIDHLIQIAAYGQLWNENHPEQIIEGYYLLRLGKEDGSFHHSYWPELAIGWEAFLHALAIYNLEKPLKSKL